MQKNRLEQKKHKKQSKATFFNYAWADRYLKFNIGILQGKHVDCSRNGRIQLVLIAKQLLREHGFDWHCRRLDNWIHRTSKLEQPKADLSQEKREREEESLHDKKPFSTYFEEVFHL